MHPTFTALYMVFVTKSMVINLVFPLKNERTVSYNVPIECARSLGNRSFALSSGWVTSVSAKHNPYSFTIAYLLIFSLSSVRELYGLRP